MHLIFRYVRPYLKCMSLGLVIKFTGTIMDLFLPYILAHIIDEIVPLQDLSLVLKWGVVFLWDECESPSLFISCYPFFY